MHSHRDDSCERGLDFLRTEGAAGETEVWIDLKPVGGIEFSEEGKAFQGWFLTKRKAEHTEFQPISSPPTEQV